MSGDAISFSQHDEDLAVAAHFENRRNGYYVEVGALDGVAYSNTCMLERALGWSGLLIEADPGQADECRKNRPRSTVIQAAVTSPDASGSELTFTVVNGMEAFSGIDLRRRANEIRTIASEAEITIETKTISVRAITLDEALAQANTPKQFEFISIDIEGHEWQALQGFSLGTRWSPQVLLIESAMLVPDLRIVHFLGARGYAFKRSIGGWNHWYQPGNKLQVSLGVFRLARNSSPRIARAAVRRVLLKLGLLETVRGRMRRSKQSRDTSV